MGPAVRALLPKGNVPEGTPLCGGAPAGSPPRWAVKTSPQRVHCTGAPPVGTRRSSSAYRVWQLGQAICTEAGAKR